MIYFCQRFRELLKWIKLDIFKMAIINFFDYKVKQDQFKTGFMIAIIKVDCIFLSDFLQEVRRCGQTAGNGVVACHW